MKLKKLTHSPLAMSICISFMISLLMVACLFMIEKYTQPVNVDPPFLEGMFFLSFGLGILLIYRKAKKVPLKI